MDTFFLPLDVEIAGECDAIVFIVNTQHLVDVNGHTDQIIALGLLDGQLKLGVLLRQAGRLVRLFIVAPKPVLGSLRRKPRDTPLIKQEQKQQG